MYFNIEADAGFVIQGYLVPDGFSSEPEVAVRVDGALVCTVKCDQYRDGPYRQRMHETGVVAFAVNESHVPGLAEIRDIEIADTETGVTIYRRFDPGRHIEKRVFRLETHFGGRAELDQSLAPHFQFHMPGVERYGSETARQALEIVHQPSTYVSGRILIKRFQVYIAEGSLTIAAMEDPFIELAARLTIISQMNKRLSGALPERDAIIFQPAIDHFADLDLGDERAVRTRIRTAPKDVLSLFQSPFTHQLTASSPTDPVQRASLASALDVLSQFTLFNSGGETEAFAQDLAELIGVPAGTVNMRDIGRPYSQTAEILRNIKTLEHLLESDLILYHFVKRAEKRAERMAMRSLTQ